MPEANTPPLSPTRKSNPATTSPNKLSTSCNPSKKIARASSYDWPRLKAARALSLAFAPSPSASLALVRRALCRLLRSSGDGTSSASMSPAKAGLMASIASCPGEEHLAAMYVSRFPELAYIINTCSEAMGGAKL